MGRAVSKLNGFFTLHRRLFEDPLWLNGTPVQKALMIYLIGKANHKPKQWIWQGKKFEIKRGQLITSLESLKKGLGRCVSSRNVRTALNNLEKYGFLTNKSTKTGRLITVCNYCKYQDMKNKSDKDSDKEVTKTRQRGDKEVTTNNNDNNDNHDNNKDILSGKGKIPYADIVAYLNKKARKNFRLVDKTKRLIKARYSEDFTIDDFKKVIDTKCRQWKADPKMAGYLRPQTLFGTKFESYLNEEPPQEEEIKYVN